jgi:3,4-dihydroxy-2-butanone 4-phosphate synthase
MQKIIDALKHGEIVMVSDDPNREDECDLICSAENLTNEQMAFIIRYTGGIVCVPTTKKILDKLKFQPMTENNSDRHKTAFTVSVDYIPGTTTGISSSDRTKTIKAMTLENVNPSDFQKPGHVFPLCSKEGGLKVRRGHTEASVELMKLAGLKPIAVISELLNDDGSTMCGNNLEIFSKKYNLQKTSVKEIYDYIYN